MLISLMAVRRSVDGSRMIPAERSREAGRWRRVTCRGSSYARARATSRGISATGYGIAMSGGPFCDISVLRSAPRGIDGATARQICERV